MDDRSRWNRRATAYPRYEKGENTYEARMLRLISENGIDFRGKRVLDLGCGSGMYTIRIAQMAESVTALDISDEMLRILTEDAAANGVTNITPVNADWLDYKPGEAFDIIFAAMTPALFSDEGKEKLMAMNAPQIVHMAYAGRQYSSIFGPLYEKYNIDRPFLRESDIMAEWLDTKGITSKRVIAEGHWEQEYTDEALKERVRQFTEQSGKYISADLLEHFRIPDTDRYADRVGYRIGIIFIQA